jgi:hypothetical protein
LATVEDRLNVLERNNVVLTQKVEELTGQFQFNSSQLASVQRYMHGRFDQIDARFDKLDGRFDKVEGRMDRLEVKVDRLEGEVVGLRRDLPMIVAETMREVLREQRPGRRTVTSTRASLARRCSPYDTGAGARQRARCVRAPSSSGRSRGGKALRRLHEFMPSRSVVADGSRHLADRCQPQLASANAPAPFDHLLNILEVVELRRVALLMRVTADLVLDFLRRIDECEMPTAMLDQSMREWAADTKHVLCDIDGLVDWHRQAPALARPKTAKILQRGQMLFLQGANCAQPDPLVLDREIELVGVIVAFNEPDMASDIFRRQLGDILWKRDLVYIGYQDDIVGSSVAQSARDSIALKGFPAPGIAVGWQVIDDDVDDFVEIGGESVPVLLKRQRLLFVRKCPRRFGDDELVDDIVEFGQSQLKNVEFIEKRETIPNCHSSDPVDRAHNSSAYGAESIPPPLFQYFGMVPPWIARTE